MRGFMAGFGCLLAVGVMALIVSITYSNKEIRLRNAAAAQEQANQAIFDTVWKTIAQQAEVTDQYKESFKDIWKNLLEAQASTGRQSTVLAFVNRVNPKFSPNLLKKLMTTIESGRKDFLNGQKALVDIKLQHDNIRQTFPGSWVCGNRPALKITIVTSAKTSDIFESSKEDDVKLFKSNK